jgi:antitoxin VapB
MSLNIKNPEAHRLARELAEQTGESLTTAVTVALRERLSGLRAVGQPGGLMAAVAEIQDFVAALPDRDCRSADEILGYDEDGLPA